MATEMNVLKAPFPYFGGKSSVAPLVWERLGNVPNYVEPFFGSGAILLGRPHEPQTETVNDLDGFIPNFWRAVQFDPESVARYVDWPVSEVDLLARHVWLVRQRETLTDRLHADPEYYDAKIAGWWCWGLCSWIGSGWCSGEGPWQLTENGVEKGNGEGAKRKLPHLGRGQGVNRQLPHLGNAGQGACADWSAHLRQIMQALSDRLRRVRVCSGDWQRVLGDSPTIKHGITAVFLDPPYADTAGRDANLYAKDSLTVAHDVREWAIANGDNPLLRIALAGYAGEHTMPDTWECVAWKARGGYGSQGNTTGRDNAHREMIWFSPHCLRPPSTVQYITLNLFGDME